MIRKYFICTIILGVFYTTSISQEYIAGHHYFDDNQYIEYVHGNFPLIISGPHGGDKKPENIPDRDCPNCVLINDSYTFELANEIAVEVINITGCIPFIILNKLHRSKLDPNRGIIEGADGNEDAESAWEYYHNHIKTAQDTIHSNHERGLLVDIHGHGHDIQRLELGYLLSKSQLNEDDEILEENDYDQFSSIRQLSDDNITGSSFSELLRGEFSLGTLISDEGYRALPSSDEEFPESDPYFTGGYITQQYGSRNEELTDAIQIECNQDVRFNANIRKEFAKKVALSLVLFMEMHYGFDGGECINTAVDNLDHQAISIYPNPASSFITINSPSKLKLQIFNTSNQVIFSKTTTENNTKIDIQHLPNGMYLSKFTDQNGHQEIHRFVKSDF